MRSSTEIRTSGNASRNALQCSANSAALLISESGSGNPWARPDGANISGIADRRPLSQTSSNQRRTRFLFFSDIEPPGREAYITAPQHVTKEARELYVVRRYFAEAGLVPRYLSYQANH